MNLSELIEKWENAALELRDAERLINLLIIDNRHLEKERARLASMIDHGLGWEDMQRDI